MTRTWIAFTSLVLSLATVALVAQAPPPVTPITTANSAGNGAGALFPAIKPVPK